MPSPLDPFLDQRSGRARFSVRPVAPAALPVVSGLLAGAAEVDITPPPGMPKAGYSANAHDGDGFRTRLRARVLHLRSGTTSLALVQCDLLGGSSVVHHLVSQAIGARTDIPLAGLTIGATHTHAGPGQFLGTDFYNRFASNRSGFDPAYTSFLVEQISNAVIEAHDTRLPALMAIGQTDVWGLTRNRSQEPHVHNETIADKRTDPQRKYLSTNPALTLIRVDSEAPEGDLVPLAATVVFSVHGTGIPMRSREYNADLWAYLVGELSDELLAHHGHRVVVGAIEGTHADVAPAIRPGAAGHLEAARVGRAIGARAAALHRRLEDDLRADVELAVGLREIDLEASPSIDGVSLPRRPAVGAALIAGAHENVTPVIGRIPPFRAGRPKRWGTDNPQGPKWVLGTRWMQPLVLPLGSFPRVLPVQVLRLGTTVVVALPFEVTVESGRRIESAVRSEVGAEVERVVVSSVANEYSGYVATAEEYELQHYEGGHTLYGPTTQRFLAAHAARLTREVLGDTIVTDVLPHREWDLRVRRFLPAPTRSSTGRSFLAPPTFHDPTRSTDGYWQVEWRDVSPGDLAWHEPIVSVEMSDDDGPWERATDDQGWAIEVSHRGSDGAGDRYRSRWYDPAFRAGRRHRFVLLANRGRPELRTDPFD